MFSVMLVNKLIQPTVNLIQFMFILMVCFSASASPLDNEEGLAFEQVINVAKKNDPWLEGNKHKQQSIESMSHAASTLPDPRMSIGMANLPTDGFDPSQEGMSQFKVGITQMFPRGDTLKVKNQQLQLQSQSYPFQRQDRQAKVTVTVGTLWLDVYRVQQSIALIENNRSLFEQLAGVAEASYSSALGKTRQQDLVRAQLELTRLDDRLDKLAQQKNNYEGQLSQWLTDIFSEQRLGSTAIDTLPLYDLKLNNKLPQLDLINAELIFSEKKIKMEQLAVSLSGHPSVLALDKKILSTKTGIQLAEQKYQPEWGVSASYGYRDDDPMGRSRADLFSVGVTFDLPLFTEKRQDKEVQSAISETEVIKTEKILLLRQLLGAYASSKGRLHRLKNRQELYKLRLLPQIHDQAEASLTAYTNDDGDFSEVVRARIAVLNAEIDELTLNVEEQKIHLELNYLFVGNINTATNNTANNKNKMTFTNSEKYSTASGAR